MAGLLAEFAHCPSASSSSSGANSASEPRFKPNSEPTASAHVEEKPGLFVDVADRPRSVPPRLEQLTWSPDPRDCEQTYPCRFP
jgi:hypothetical protein